MKNKKVESLVNDVIKIFPKFFDNFKDWQYETGYDAGKDFERIYKKSLAIKKRILNEKLKGNG